MSVGLEKETTAEADLTPRDYSRAVRRISLWLLALGVVLRIARYLLPSPIWGDEAMLAINIIDRDYRGLTQYLEHAQVAPVLFLWAERFALTLLGSQEWAMRFFPLLAGLGGLIFFWEFARRSVSPLAAGIGVGLLGVSIWPVSLASTLKPYSADLFWSALLLHLAVKWHRRPERLRPLVGLLLAVPFALAGSYPTVFVAGGISLYLLPIAWRAGNGIRLLFGLYNLAMVGTFGLIFLTVGQSQVDPNLGPTGEFMRNYWRNGFPPGSLWELPLWLLDAHTGRMFAYPAGDSHGGSTLTAILFFIGVVWCWRNGHRPLLLVCLAPFGLTMLAAVMGKYPYAGCCRLTQHLAPAICLLTGVGIAAIIEKYAPRRSDRLLALRWCAGVFLLFGMGMQIQKCIQPDRDRICRFSKNFHRELAWHIGPNDRLVVLDTIGLDATTKWYLKRFGEQVRWQPADPDLSSETQRVWVVTMWPGPTVRDRHEKYVASLKPWQAGDTLWYVIRPEKDDPDQIYWSTGVTCLRRPGDERQFPMLNTLP
jgi:hypothetical protein